MPVSDRKRVGVLALQGDFEAHAARIGAGRRRCDRGALRGAIAGHRRACNSGRREHHDAEAARHRRICSSRCKKFGESHPVFGTCAGAILLASEVTNPSQASLGLMDIEVERNAYGRQIDSRIAHLEPEGIDGDLEAVFIRAPIIRRVGENAKVLARYDGDPVLVEQGRHLVATFHPELTGDARIHKMFLDKVE